MLRLSCISTIAFNEHLQTCATHPKHPNASSEIALSSRADLCILNTCRTVATRMAKCYIIQIYIYMHMCLPGGTTKLCQVNFDAAWRPSARITWHRSTLTSAITGYLQGALAIEKKITKQPQPTPNPNKETSTTHNTPTHNKQEQHTTKNKQQH